MHCIGLCSLASDGSSDSSSGLLTSIVGQAVVNGDTPLNCPDDHSYDCYKHGAVQRKRFSGLSYHIMDIKRSLTLRELRISLA